MGAEGKENGHGMGYEDKENQVTNQTVLMSL